MRDTYRKLARAFLAFQAGKVGRVAIRILEEGHGT
jgi:hypothetical protein